jgi:putative membrane fusion protein
MARLERRGKRMSVIRVGLLLGMCIIALGIIYKFSVNTISTITRFNRDIKVVEYGTIEDKASGKAIVINNEDVVQAQSNGHFENIVKEQEKVSKGALLGYFVNAQGQTPMLAEESGTFIGKVDGLEQVFSNIDLQTVTPDIYKYKITQVKDDQPVLAGQPVFKIVDNLVPTRLLVSFPQSSIDFDVKLEQQVKIVMGGKELGNATITNIRQDFGELLLIVQFKGFQDDLLQQRFVDVDVVFDSSSGYLVPKKAVVESAGNKGIYCSNGEDISFKPVNIIKTKDDICLVEGLKQNDMIVTNPPE